jgi:hypothetical protein
MNAYVTLPEDVKKLANKNMALVKVKIQKADHYQTRSMHKTGWWQTAWYSLSTWFRQSSYRQETYFPAS